MKYGIKNRILSLALCICMLVPIFTQALPAFATGSEATAPSVDLKDNVGNQAVFEWWSDFLLIDEDTLKNSTSDELNDYYGNSEVGYENWVLYDDIPAGDLILTITDYFYDKENGDHWYKLAARDGETLPEVLQEKPWVYYANDADFEEGKDPYLVIYDKNDTIRIVYATINGTENIRFILSSASNALADAQIAISDYNGEYNISDLAYIYEESIGWADAQQVQITKTNGDAWSGADVGILYTAQNIATDTFEEDTYYAGAFLYVDDTVYSAAVTDKMGYEASDIVYTNSGTSIIVYEFLDLSFEWLNENAYFTNESVTLYDNVFGTKNFLAAELPAEFTAEYTFTYNGEEYYWLTNKGFIGSPYFLAKTEDVTLGELPEAFGDGRVTITDENGDPVSEITLKQTEKSELAAITTLGQLSADISYLWQIEYEDGKWVDIYGEKSKIIQLSYGMIASLLGADGTVNIRCKTQAASQIAYSSPIPVTVDSTQTTFEPFVSIQIDGADAESVTTTTGNENFKVKLTATTNLTGILTYSWEALSDAENEAWTEISAGESCTVKYSDLDFVYNDASSDVSAVTLTVTNGYYTESDTFIIYRIAPVQITGSSESNSETVDVTVSGNLPENASLNLVDASDTTIGGVEADEIALALDVTITKDGSEWQPNAGESVRVSIPASQLGLQDGDYFTVYHIHDGKTELLGPFVVSGGYATFDIDGFSVVVISTNYGASIGATAELSQQIVMLYPTPDSLNASMTFNTSLPQKIIITDYYFDEGNARLLYKINAAPGYTWPATLEGIHWCESTELTNINVNGTAGVFDANGNPVDDASVTTSAGVVVSAITSLQSADISYKWQICYDTENDLWVDISGQNSKDITIVAGMVISLKDENDQVRIRCVTTAGSKTVITEPIIITLLEPTPGNDTVDVLVDGVLTEGLSISASELAAFNSTLSASTTLTGDLTYSWEVLFDKDYDMWWLQGQDATFKPVFDAYMDGTYLDSNFIHALDDTTSEVHIRLTVSNGTTTARNTFVITVDNEESAIAAYSPVQRSRAVKATDSGATVAEDTKIYKIVINYLYYHNMEIAATPYTSTVGATTQITDPVVFPTVVGYLPYVMDENGNLVRMDEYKFDGLLTEDFEMTVYYKPKTVSYTINIYTQNAEDDNYQLLMTRTGSALTGTVIESIEMPLNGYYQTKMTTTTASVAPDGSTVFNLYYDRIYYLMKFDLDGGYGVQPIYARHGTKLDIPSPTKAGYAFVGWDNITTGSGDGIADTLPTEMPLGNTTYKAIWKAADNAKVTIVYWGKNPNDEGYSYKESAEIYAKVGSTLTFGSTNNQMICTLDEHTHTDACESKTVCGQEGHQHGNGCYGNCTHATHETSCYTSETLTTVSSLGNYSYAKSAYNALIQKVQNPISGTIYRYRYYGTNYNFFYLNNTWYYLGEGNDRQDIAYTGTWQNPNNNNYNTVTAVADCSRSHTHTDACLDCSLHVHTASCYPCIAHTHTNSCYLKTPTGAEYDPALWTLKTEKIKPVTVAADGSTVINVYYDRVEYTLTFSYSYSGGKFQKVKEITAKWGAKIDTEYTAIADDCGSTFWSHDSDGDGPYTNYFGVMPKPFDEEGNATDYTYFHRDANGDEGTMYYKGADLTGEYTVDLFSVPNVGGYSITDEDKYEFEGYKFSHFDADYNSYYGSYSCSGAIFYYTRNSYRLEFNNGEKIVKTVNAPYQTLLSTYAFTPTAPSFYEAGSVQFAGWYQNPECTGDEVILSETEMPSSNKILYAKWEPVNHNVTIYRYKNADGTFPTGNDIIQQTIKVPHGSFLQQQYIPEDPENQPYTFVGWFYMDGGVEKAFDFVNMPVKQDLDIYGKWSSNVQLSYTIKYVLAGTDTEIAEREEGKQFAGETMTFLAKTASDLNPGYQSGYFPTISGHSIAFDLADGVTSYEYTFEYVAKESVPYTVYYLAETLNEGTTSYGTMEYDGKTYYKIVADKTVSSKNAIVTENFVQVQGYMPNAYQQSLVLSGVDGAVNEIYFFYTVDTQHAYYKVSHYTQNLDGSWYEYSTYESIGNIGAIYTESSRTINGFTYNPGIAGTLTTGELTAEGLHLKLYYTRNKYPYKVEYRIEGAGTLLATDYFTTEELMEYFGQTIAVTPGRTFTGYHLVSTSPITHIIQIEQDANMQDPKANVIIFYYAEDEVTINYEIVGPNNSCGTVSPESETIKVITGNPLSAADANPGYKFLGWYKDAACTQLITTSRIIQPEKVNDVHVAATYYAKFEEIDVTIHYEVSGPAGCGNVAPGAETLGAATGVASGSTATANPGYKFVGWYDANGNQLGTSAKFAPTKAATELWVDGTTYYARFEEIKVTINYVAVGPDGATNFGTVSPTTQTVGAVTGNPSSTASASSNVYKFVGWYSDAACTQKIGDGATYNPQRVDGLHVSATYYAKFEYNLTSLTIKKTGCNTVLDPFQSFLFDVVEVDANGNVVTNGVNLTVTVHENGSITIDGLTVGNRYVITEKNDWSWRYNCTGWSYGVVTGSGNSATITLGVSGNEITFTNDRPSTNNKWLDGNSWTNNLFK